MRENIEKFCDDIKEWYCLYLYEKGTDLAFPYCCKLSADLITSYLKMVCSDSFKYICTTREKIYNHAWTYYKDEKEEFIIDFTYFQYTNDDSKRIKNREITCEELNKILAKEKVIFDREESFMDYEWMYPKEQKCYGILENFEGNLSKKCFMDYLEKSYDIVFAKTVYI